MELSIFVYIKIHQQKKDICLYGTCIIINLKGLSSHKNPFSSNLLENSELIDGSQVLDIHLLVRSESRQHIWISNRQLIDFSENCVRLNFPCGATTIQ